jgi:hypothetical protein
MTRAEKRRQLRDAGQKRAPSKRGRRNWARMGAKPVLPQLAPVRSGRTPSGLLVITEPLVVGQEALKVLPR